MAVNGLFIFFLLGVCVCVHCEMVVRAADCSHVLANDRFHALQNGKRKDHSTTKDTYAYRQTGRLSSAALPRNDNKL